MTQSDSHSSPVEDHVRFEVSFDCVEHDGYWVARTVETGVVGGWFTHEEAEDAAALANRMLVEEIKKDGQVALDSFFKEHNMKYTFVGLHEQGQTGNGERRVLIA